MSGSCWGLMPVIYAINSKRYVLTIFKSKYHILIWFYCKATD